LKYLFAFVGSLGTSLVLCGCFQYIWNTYVTILGAVPLGYWQAFGVSLLASWASMLLVVIPRTPQGTTYTGSFLSYYWAVLLVKVFFALYLWAMAYLVSFLI